MLKGQAFYNIFIFFALNKSVFFLEDIMGHNWNRAQEPLKLPFVKTRIFKMPSFSDLLLQFAFNLPYNDKLILNRARRRLLNPMWLWVRPKAFSFLSHNQFYLLLKGWMGVRAGVIYPAFSLLSLRFVFSCSCYGCLLVVAAENHRSM